MSVCAKDCSGAGECAGCRHRQPTIDISPMEDVTRREDLEEMLAELKGLRLGARVLKRSGNPEVRAEGERALTHIEDEIQWVLGQLSKVEL